MAERRVQLQVRIQPALKRRLTAAAERRLLSESRLTELALRDALDRIDREDAPVAVARARRALLEEAAEA